MCKERHQGFVIGSDFSPHAKGGKVWKVRVNDPESQYLSRKFTVASVHDNIELAKGLNVNFLVGSMDGPGRSEMLRAVDVRLNPAN